MTPPDSEQRAQSVSDTGSQETASSGDQSQGGNASPQGQSAAPVQIDSQTMPSLPLTTLRSGRYPPIADCTNPRRCRWAPQRPPTTLPPHDRLATACAGYQHSEVDPEHGANRDASWYAVQRLWQHLDQHICHPGSDLSADFARSRRASQDTCPHLPEMQARLGGNQAMDVRIDMNGQAQAETRPACQTDRTDGSRGERQQKGGTASNQPGDVSPGRKSRRRGGVAVGRRQTHNRPRHQGLVKFQHITHLRRNDHASGFSELHFADRFKHTQPASKRT